MRAIAGRPHPNRWAVLAVSLLLAALPAVPANADARFPPATSPKPGTADWRVTREVVRRAAVARYRQPLSIDVQSLRIANGWAFLQGVVVLRDRKAQEKLLPDCGEMAALLRKRSGVWRLLVWDVSCGADVLIQARARYPQAPRAIFP